MNHTIDRAHSQMLENFHNDEFVVIPELLAKKEALRNRLLSLKKVGERIDVKDQLKDINHQIQELRLAKKNYLLDNSKHVFTYFEEKQNISSGSNKNVSVLNQFFKRKAEPESDEKAGLSKQSIAQYWKNVSNEIVNASDFVVPTDICFYCRKGEMIPQDDDGILLCNNIQCGKFVQYMVDNNKPANKEAPSEVSYTAYIRLNHFKEILSQFQAKETTQIPDQVIADIRLRIKKERITNVAEELNYDRMREILRKLGYNKYFEHIQYINSIFGIRPPIMDERLHETLCVLFVEIQKPWAVHCPPNRTNFFNYTYTLYQLCVLLDQTQYLPYIPMMKDREKQLEQDMIWKKVCQDLDWEFFPSV